MSPIPYTYSVVKYIHDPVADERLNVGVVVWAPSAPFMGAKFEYRFERLSSAFVDFDGDHYKRSLRQFEAAMNRLQEHLPEALFKKWESPEDVAGLVRYIWPDESLSFQLGPILAGVTDNPEAILEEIFDAMVASLYPKEKVEKRSDEEIWRIYQRPLIESHVNRRLYPKTIVTSEFEIKFDHTFKNERWHVLQPVSMDFVRREQMQRKATTWLGNATALEDHPELGKLYILLGKPRQPGHQKAYEKAKNLLHKMRIKHEIYEEDAAQDLANYIADEMKKHGVGYEPPEGADL